MLSYKGYHGKFEVDFDANIIHGEVVDVKDVITFQGRSPEELEQAFRDSVDDYLEYCAEIGQEPDRPFSGQFLVRAEPEVHRCLYVAAAVEGKSLNQFVVERLSEVAEAWLSGNEGRTSSGQRARSTTSGDEWRIDHTLKVMRSVLCDVASESAATEWVSQTQETSDGDLVRAMSSTAVVCPEGQLSGFGTRKGK